VSSARGGADFEVRTVRAGEVHGKRLQHLGPAREKFVKKVAKAAPQAGLTFVDCLLC
jgi:hypothetical protein